jgi:uncharacterized protein (TIGR03084 family)
VNLSTVLDDLRAEAGCLDRLLDSLPAPDWQRMTPAAGWTIAHQVAHLAHSEEVALRAVEEDGFDADLAEYRDQGPSVVDAAADGGAGSPPGQLATRWQRARRDLAEALGRTPPGARIRWFGPPMSPVSMARARLMETWAHGLDVRDALGIPADASPRLLHVAELGVRTRDYSFRRRGLTPPTEPTRVELIAPDGDLWTWGPPLATDRLVGSALDFCLLVTRRRPVETLRLGAIGTGAVQWKAVAQAFAG